MKVVAIDLDGTLLNDEKKVLAESKEILRKLHEKGIEVLLVTGRSYVATRETLKDLGLPITAICYNGGKVVKFPEEEILFEQNLPNEVSQKLVKLSREEGVHLNLYMNETWSVENGSNKWSERYQKACGLPIKEEDFTKIENIITTKAIIMAEPEKIQEILPRLEKEIGEKTNLITAHGIYLEIVDKEINKGKILEKTLKEKGYSIKDCIAFGDGENDVEMISMAGIGVAMKNAVGELKKVAKVEAEATNNEGGIHKFLEKHFEELLGN